MPEPSKYRIHSNGLEGFTTSQRYWMAEAVLGGLNVNNSSFEKLGIWGGKDITVLVAEVVEDHGGSRGEGELAPEFLAVATRIEELRKLEAGWLDGTGEVPDSAGLDWLHEHLDTLMLDYGVPFPRLYPTTEGNIQAEWEGAEWEIEVEYDLISRQALVSLFCPTDANRDKELSVAVEPRAGVMKLALLLLDHLDLDADHE